MPIAIRNEIQKRYFVVLSFINTICSISHELHKHELTFHFVRQWFTGQWRSFEMSTWVKCFYCVNFIARWLFCCFERCFMKCAWDIEETLDASASSSCFVHHKMMVILYSSLKGVNDNPPPFSPSLTQIWEHPIKGQENILLVCHGNRSSFSCSSETCWRP